MKSHTWSIIIIIVNHHLHGIAAFLLLLLFLSSMANAQQPSDSTSTADEALNSSNVSPSMAVIVIVLVLAFFITGSVSIYIQQCADVSSLSTAPIFVAGVAGGRSRRGGSVRGIDQSVIHSFPTFLYSAVKELKIGKGSLECAVCLNEFEDDETLRLLPKCDHVFHPECIDTWLADHNTCPVCRANLVPEPGDAANAAESTHEIDSEDEQDTSSSADEIPRCEARITINDEGTATDEAPKRHPNRKFPRSHSTGHSLIQSRQDWERYTLRLPAEVRRQLVARPKLKRTSSLMALPRESSSRRGYRSGGGDRDGSGSSRYGRIFGRPSERWPFNFQLPPFVSRVGSFTSTTKGEADGDVTAGSVGSKRLSGNAVTPLESLPPLPV